MKRLRRLPIILAPLLVAGCSVGPDYVTPTAPMPTGNFKEFGGTWEPAKPSDDAIRGKWWEIYHDPELNALEEKVNISNQNVIEAEAQFREAAAAVKVARAAYYPTVTADPAYTFSQQSQNVGSSRGGAGGSSFGGGGGGGKGPQHVGALALSLYDLPIEGSYMVDIWGSVRRNVEEQSATAEASFANLENMRLSFQATLAQDYFELHGQDAEADLLTRSVKSFEDFLTLTKNRYNSGIASQGDVALAQTQLDTTRAQLIDLGVARAQFEHAIAVLTGQPPSDFALKEVVLKGTPPHVPVGVPSKLLQRRPDVAEAERQVASANAAIGVQVAGYFPQLTLTAQTGLEATELSQLATGPSFLWSVGAALAQTVFDAGATHGRVQEAQANYDATVANYRQTVLTAMQQVEDDLAGLRILESEAAAEDIAVKSANVSLDVSTNQYKAGIVDYLTVITAQTTALSDEVQAVNIRTRRMTTSVLLVEALGGGWTSATLPGVAGVADVPQSQQQIDKGKK
ncbi:MAG TPA: efflux transporter outer membrane subunit [Candidatus Methylacidiphilales bacterium]|jgi:NodT family efflux transporter outer membrane factor (OMF) lipoprotein|nr:efflux transporter outer membrane subunit [Candidatus Methylacidiphilales bacterium]